MRAAACTLALLGLALPIQASALTPEAPHATPLLANLPLLFVENRGQLDEAVRFSVPGSGRTLYFTREGITVAFEGDGQRWALQLDFVDANPDVILRGEEMQPTVFSYFKGNDPAKWQAGCPTYSKIVYKDLWPGIDLVYRGEVNRLKHEFVVAPGADPRHIRFTVGGATAARLDGEGDLVLETPLGSFEDARPLAYQIRDGVREDVAAAFTLGETEVSLALASFDRALPLVVDPETILFSAYLGGSFADCTVDIATDASGNTYVTGWTYSPDFPTVVGPDLSWNGAASDGFVAKIDASGDFFVYCGFLGGSDDDAGQGIAADASGAAFVTGSTRSDDFPTVGGLDPTFHGGLEDAFVLKVSPTGDALLYSGFLGGAGIEEGNAIAVDDAGAAYVTGSTTSTDFPTLGALDPTYNGGDCDAFVAKVHPDGSALAYSGFLGGSYTDHGRDIAVDDSGAAYLTGETESFNFPTVGGFDPIYNGGFGDAFVTKVAPEGNQLVFSSFLGGNMSDVGEAIAVDASHAAFVTGTTGSYNFPTVGDLGPMKIGNNDVFVTKIHPTGGAIEYSGFLGGSDHDYGRGIAVDAMGTAYVTGYTQSDDIPTAGGLGPSPNGSDEVFLALVSPSGGGLLASGYLGGGSNDFGFALALDPTGAMLVGGKTYSTDFPIVGPLGPSYGGGTFGDGFVTKIRAHASDYCRAGTVGDPTGPLAAVVLRINGSEGDADRIVVATVGSEVVITMDPPPLGPSPSPFAMYGWVGEPNASTVTLHPKGVGMMCFPTPVTGGLPQPRRIWNNIGHFEILGYPHFPSEPAPSTPLSKVWGIPFAITATFQGFIFDDGSGASHPVSLTNAVILQVVP